MAIGSGDHERSLEQTPTWAVVVVCSFFVIVSLLLEQTIHHVGTWLSRRHKKALYDALEKLKAELMLMGFISFLLTIGQKPISKICVPEGIAFSMLPCQKNESTATGTSDHCSKEVNTKEGKYPLVSLTGLNQLHYFIFTLATLHVLYSVLTIALATEKMRRWKAWEKEIKTIDYQFSHDPERFRLTHQTSFVRRHMSLWSRTPILKWLVCFFRQFFWSITKVDYLTLRHGFIIAHFSGNNKFDFHKYIKRSLDDDFSKVIGISVPLWVFAMVFLLINVHNWLSYLWFSFVPLAMVLIVGMKLQLIILEMALEIQGRNVVTKGIPVVQLNDKLFWFDRPELILFLIHFTLFENAFQLGFFLWTWWQFGLNSCFHERFYGIIIRISIGVVVQFICSYVTLPLYALVTQMGSRMKNTIFEERVASGLRRWHQRAKKNKKEKNSMENTLFEERIASGLRRWHHKAKKKTKKGNSDYGFSSKTRNSESGFSRRGGTRSAETPSHGSSPVHLLRRYDTVRDIETPDISPRYYHSEYGTTESPECSEAANKQHQHPRETSNLEMVASSAYAPQRTRTVLSAETSEIKEASKDVNGSSRDFSFV